MMSIQRSSSAHPRSRGEHYIMCAMPHYHPGSSPLARGTRKRTRAFPPYLRLIPARAGNTSTAAGTGVSMTAHPRSRGEHHRLDKVGMTSFGSSPLARGTRTVSTATPIALWLIPARAGNTRMFPDGVKPVAAHPRSRGEHVQDDYPARARHGSSPLARGTPDQRHLSFSTQRLIPARAGNTQRAHHLSCNPPAHPRSRGEHNLYFWGV